MKSVDTELNEISKNWIDLIANETKFNRLENKKIQVSTPYTDSFGDGLVFNVVADDHNKYTLTDEGYTIWNLQNNGVNLKQKNSNRWRILLSIIKPDNFMVGQKDEIFKTDLLKKDLPQAITDFVQILINVSDIAYMNRTNTAGIFFDDAKNYFYARRTQFSFIPSIYTDGKSNLKYKFEYLFTTEPNNFKLTKLYNTLSKNSMDAIIGIWSDTVNATKENYGNNTTFNVLLNGISDTEQPFIEGLQQHDIRVIDFQNKNQVNEQLGIK